MPAWISQSRHFQPRALACHDRGAIHSRNVSLDYQNISLLAIVAICVPAWYGLIALDFRHPAGIVSLTAETTYTWTIHPARKQPWLAVIVLGSLIVCSYCIATWGGHWAWGVLAAAVFTWTLQQFWWPTVYLVDKTSIHIRMGLAESSVTWADVLSVTVDDRGGLVRLRRPSRRYLQSRDLTLTFANNSREVIEQIHHHVPDLTVIVRKTASVTEYVTSVSSEPHREETV